MDRRATTPDLDDRQDDAARTVSKPRKGADERVGVTLLVRHPNADLRELLRILDLKPYRAWKRGDAITTPKGTVMPGKYSDSRWNHVWRLRRRETFPTKLREIVDQIAVGEKQLRQVGKSGGDAQLIVRISGFNHLGDTIEADVLGRMSDLGLSLGFEVFGEPQRH